MKVILVNKKFYNSRVQLFVFIDRGIFYMDSGHSFDKVLFYGHEWTFFLFELMNFIFIVMLTGNYLVACLTVAIVNRVSIFVNIPMVK